MIEPLAVCLLLCLLALISASNGGSHSCGTLMGDGRFCLDYSNQLLINPPSGSNITSILNLSRNKIPAVTSATFSDQLLLVKLNLSHNEITTIDGGALWRLSLLKEIQLGNNRYVCDTRICSFRTWLNSNSNMVKDLNDVVCHSPGSLVGTKIIDINPSFLCNNKTIDSIGFEVNTGTVFLIWIVVPILITFLTAIYIVLNGDNRLGRLARSGCTGFCHRLFLRGTRREQTEEEEGARREVLGGGGGAVVEDVVAGPSNLYSSAATAAEAAL